MNSLVKTNNFQFSMATLLVGLPGTLRTLTLDANSLGLVKNVMIDSTQTTVELTQGLTNDIVASFVNDLKVKCTAEVYEYTARNIAYGMSMDGSQAGLSPMAPPTALAAAVLGGATTFTLTGDQTLQFPAGGLGYLQEGLDDAVFNFGVTSSVFATGITTVTITNYPVPATMAFSTARGNAGGIVAIRGNSALSGNTYLCAKILGMQSHDKSPIIIVLPKIKILKGFSFHFDNKTPGNLPFEIVPYVPLPTDIGYDPDFAEVYTIQKNCFEEEGF